VTPTEFSSFDEEWAKKLEEDYLDYMSSLWENEDAETLSGMPFDGCETCEVREQLFFLAPRIIEGYKTGKIDIAITETE
jgi:hypothetical protein